MLRSSLLMLVLLGTTAALAAPDRDETLGVVDPASLLAMDPTGRAARMDQWRTEAARRFQAADDALWLAERDATRRCRQERLEQARRFLDALDTLGHVLLSEHTTEARRQTAAELLVRAWRPLAAVEPLAPCEPDPAPSDGLTVTRTVPTFDGLADLPDVLEDDPMSAGADTGRRRPLRP